MASEPSFVNQYPTLVDFESRFRQQTTKTDDRTLCRVINGVKNSAKKVKIKEIILKTFPIIDTLATYDVKGNLLSDGIAGIMAGVTMIPQSMAFATLSTLPHYVGLYMSFFAPLTYLIFGTSRHLAWGCVAIVSIMMADIMSKYDHSDEAKNFILNWNATHAPQNHVSPSPNTSSHPFSTSFFDNQMDPAAYENVYDYLFTSNSISSSHDIKNVETLEHMEKLLEAIESRRIEVACGVTVICGFIFIFVSRIGFHHISTVMSNSLVTGFAVGISMHIATSQMKGVLGLRIKRYSGNLRLFRTWIAIFEHISDTNKRALVISLVCMVIIYIVKRFINDRYKRRLPVPIPIELFVVIAGILLSYYRDYITNHDVRIVGKVPSGMPAPKFPDLSLSAKYTADALVVMVVSFAQSVAMAKTMGLDFGYEIDPQQEMLANGIASTVSGMFSGYIPGGSVSVSLIQLSAGGKSRVASLFAATIILLVILVMGPYVKHLPTCVMAAIILVNLRSMFTKLAGLPSEWRTSRYDCAVWIFTFLVTIVLDTGLALLLGIAFSMVLVIVRTMIKPVYEIGRIKTDQSSFELRSFENYKQVEKLSNVRLVKIKTPILFFNSDILVSSIIESTGIDPGKIKSFPDATTPVRERRKSIRSTCSHPYDKLDELSIGSPCDIDNNEALPVLSVKAIILDISEVSFIDAMGVQALETVVRKYSSVRVDILLVSIPETIFDMLQSTGFWDRHKTRLYLNVSAALASLPPTVQKYQVFGESEMLKSTESVY